MRSVFVTLVTCSLLLCTGESPALTVYYQPTPVTENFVDSYYPVDQYPEENLQASHAWEGWLNSARDKTLVRDSSLMFGNRRRTRYISYAKFDLTGLPVRVDSAVLQIAPYADEAEPWSIDIATCLVLRPWLPTLTWKTLPTYDSDCKWSPVTPGTWVGVDLTDWYNGWRDDSIENNGVMLAAEAKKDGLAAFRSTRYDDFATDPYADGKRPVCALTFEPPEGMPDFKLPLPQGRWLLSGEIGGYECRGLSPWPDEFHQSNSYFSLDLLPVGVRDNGVPYTGSISVLAAASGVVVENATTSWNGNYVTINHSGFSTTTDGYTTKYLHLASPSAKAVGSTVARGDTIGVMGTSGASTGVHLHFGVYYNGSGKSTEENLTYAVVDGLLLKSYQTECSYDVAGNPTEWIRYYRSTNRANGGGVITFGGF